MRIVCPNCQATYELPPSLIDSATRQVRCARCQTEWQPQEFATPPRPTVERAIAAFGDPADVGVIPGRSPPETPAREPPAPDPAAVEPVVSLDTSPRVDRALSSPPPSSPPRPRLDGDAKALHRRQGPGVRIEVLAALGFSLLLVVVIAVEAYVWRDAVMQAWPASTRLFALLPSFDVPGKH
jgi:predicted Zn finger-like uncharacterized protein